MTTTLAGERAHVCSDSVTRVLPGGRLQLEGGCRPRANAQKELVERVHQPQALPVDERVHDRPSHGVEGRGISTRTTGKRPQHAERLDPLAPALAEEGRGAHCRREEPVARTEQRLQRHPQLLRAKRLVLEQGELEAVERLAELAVVVRERQPAPELRSEPRRVDIHSNGVTRGSGAATGNTGRMP